MVEQNADLIKQKAAVTHSESAASVNGGMEIMDKMKMNDGNENLQKPAPLVPRLQDLSLQTSKLTDNVQVVKVTALAPNPGYGLEITGIEFVGSKAYLTVETIRPKPGQMYPQVITEVSAVTYIDSSYTAELRQAENPGSMSARPFRGGILPGKNAR